MNVEFNDAALEDTEAAIAWYHDINERLGQLFLAALANAVKLVREAPNRWPHRGLGTRSYILHHFPYRLVYRVKTDAIEVVALSHHRQRPDHWHQRLR